jgi:poly-gamma-glutamate system protein
MLLLAGVAAACYFACERWPTAVPQPYFAEKQAAAALAQRAFDVIRVERLQRGPPIDVVADPLGTGLIGRQMSAVTTHSGSLTAKRTSVNPNFAAVLVQWLRDAGVAPGDTVAVGMSGSFPAFNVAALAAMHVLQVRPLVMVSAGASQWGANDPNFLWLDMYRVLLAQHIVDTPPLAASRGGIGDRAERLSQEGAAMLDAGIARSGVPALPAPTYAASLDAHMQHFARAAAGAPIKAYINVGAGATSVGPRIGKHLFRPGLSTHVEEDRFIVDSIMQRFADAGVPIIHIIKAKVLAQQEGLPVDPKAPPRPGDGAVFYHTGYNLKLACLGMACTIGTMVSLVAWQHTVRRRRAGDTAV